MTTITLPANVRHHIASFADIDRDADFTPGMIEAQDEAVRVIASDGPLTMTMSDDAWEMIVDELESQLDRCDQIPFNDAEKKSMRSEASKLRAALKLINVAVK